MNDIVPMPRQAPALAVSDSLMKLIADPNTTAEKLQVIVNMQKAIMEDVRREAFQAAFALMAPELPKINKRGFVELIKADGKKVGSYRYMKYEDMDDITRPIMFRHGFSLSFSTFIMDGKNVLRGKLMHTGGHFEVSELALPLDTGPGRNPLQASGSTLSYEKRYIAELLMNIVRKGEDDDGVAFGLALLTPEQVASLINLLSDTGTNTETFLQMFVTDATKLEEIPQRDYARLKNALEQKAQALARAKEKADGRKK